MQENQVQQTTCQLLGQMKPVKVIQPSADLQPTTGYQRDQQIQAALAQARTAQLLCKTVSKVDKLVLSYELICFLPSFSSSILYSFLTPSFLIYLLFSVM